MINNVMATIASIPQMIDFTLSEDYVLTKLNELDEIEFNSNSVFFIKNAVRYDYIDVAKYIIKRDVTLLSKLNAVHFIDEIGSVDMLEVLLELDKYIDFTKKNNSLLHKCIINDEVKMVKRLLTLIDKSRFLCIDQNISSRMRNLLILNKVYIK